MKLETVNFRFLNFKVYKDSRDFYKEVIILTSTFPPRYFHLCDQLKRAALSVVLNLAEGSAKKSDIDFNRYIKNCLGSINECVAALDIAYEQKLLSEKKFDSLIEQAGQIANQLGGFSKVLKKSF